VRPRPFRWIRLDDGCVKSLTIVRYVLAKNGPRAAFDFRRYRIFLTTVRFGANLKQEKISPTPAACGVLYSYRTERFDNVSLSFIKPPTTPRRSVCLNENRSFRRSGTVRIRFQNSRACFDAKTTVRTHSRVTFGFDSSFLAKTFIEEYRTTFFGRPAEIAFKNAIVVFLIDRLKFAGRPSRYLTARNY